MPDSIVDFVSFHKKYFQGNVFIVKKKKKTSFGWFFCFLKKYPHNFFFFFRRGKPFITESIIILQFILELTFAKVNRHLIWLRPIVIPIVFMLMEQILFLFFPSPSKFLYIYIKWKRERGIGSGPDINRNRWYVRINYKRTIKLTRIRKCIIVSRTTSFQSM